LSNFELMRFSFVRQIGYG